MPDVLDFKHQCPTCGTLMLAKGQCEACTAITEYQPKTGVRCGCRRGVQRDNCPNCEGTGWAIDFRAILERSRS